MASVAPLSAPQVHAAIDQETSGIHPKSNPPPARAKSNYIVNPTYDWLLFLSPPLLALAIGIAVSGTWLANDHFQFWDQDFTVAKLLMGFFIQAHIFIVVFRSHGNPSIRVMYPWRFVSVPIILYVAMVSSIWVITCVSVLVTFWDVYHSGMQTFGFARIYERKAGNDPLVGRKLDWWLNHLLYAGPILAGASMMDHFKDFGEFKDVGSVFFSSVPAFMQGNQAYFTWSVICGGTLFLLYYVFAQWRFYKQGHNISKQKVFLLATTGFVSIYTWGFNTWGEAFLIMNFFHALQYFGLVWATEKQNIMRVFRVETHRFGKSLALGLLIALSAAYGYFVMAIQTEWYALWAITLVASAMHFWYDAFIWSVQKKQVG